MSSIPSWHPEFSPQERSAFDTLCFYGIDFGPAYIGRARAWFADKEPSAQQIVDYVMELIDFDSKQRQFMTERDQAADQARLVDWLAATSNDPDIRDLKNILREAVDLERAKLAKEQPDLLTLSAPIRITLNPDKIPKPNTDPCYIGSLHLGSRTFTLRAWMATNRDFINLEFRPHEQ